MPSIAVVLIFVGIMLMVIGFRDHQENFLSAVIGKPVGKPSLT